MDVERWRKWRESGKWVAGNLRLMSQHHRSLHPAQINTPSTPPETTCGLGVFFGFLLFFSFFFPFLGTACQIPFECICPSRRRVRERGEEQKWRRGGGKGAFGFSLYWMCIIV